MKSVAVKEILTYGERLGITEIVSPPDIRGAVRHLLRYTVRESGHGMAPFPHSMLILPPEAAGGAFESGWNRSVSPSPCKGGFESSPCETRPCSCLALPAQKITVFLRQFSERTGMPIFSSRYDDSLLYSRLTGLLRERGERQVMVHGVLVQVCGLGVLLVGESGIGKTACGLALMGKGNRWVADDAVVLEGRGDAVYGRGHQKTARRIAVRGRGILQAAALLGTGSIIQETRVDALVRLARGTEINAVQERVSFQEMVGVSLPCLDLAADVDLWRVAKRVRDYVRSPSTLEKGGSG